MTIKQVVAGRQGGLAAGRPRRGYTPRLSRTTLTIAVDLGLFGLLLATGITAYLDKPAHIVVGTAMVVALIAHLALHWTWISSVVRRFMAAKRAVKLKALLDLAMLAVFVPLTLSGGIVALIWAPAVTTFHSAMFYLLVVLIGLHLAANGKWIMSKLKGGRR